MGDVPGGAQTPRLLLGWGCAPESRGMLLGENTAQQGGHLLPQCLALPKSGRGSSLLRSSPSRRAPSAQTSGVCTPLSIVPCRGESIALCQHCPAGPHPLPPSPPQPPGQTTPAAWQAQLTSGSPVPPSRSPPAAAVTSSDTREPHRDATRRSMGSSWERADRRQPHRRPSLPPPPPSLAQPPRARWEPAVGKAELPPHGCGVIWPPWVGFKRCFGRHASIPVSSGCRFLHGSAPHLQPHPAGHSAPPPRHRLHGPPRLSGAVGRGRGAVINNGEV